VPKTSAAYDRIGQGYARVRRPDPKIAAQLAAAIGPGTVLNVGAGSGSYETPACVLAVEPSAVMIAQRPAGAAQAVRGVAEALPAADGAGDVAHGLADPPPLGQPDTRVRRAAPRGAAR